MKFRVSDSYPNCPLHLTINVLGLCPKSDSPLKQNDCQKYLLATTAGKTRITTSASTSTRMVCEADNELIWKNVLTTILQLFRLHGVTKEI